MAEQQSKTIKNIKTPYPTEGVIRSAQLYDSVCPENSVQIAVNLNFDSIGTYQTRLGVATYATTLAGSVKSFGTLNLSSANTLFAQVGTDVSAWNGTTWTSVRTLSTAVNKARFSQFLNYTFMCNGNNGDDIQASSGATFSAVVGIVPVGFPKVDYIQAGFDGRLWGLDKATDTLYYSDIVQFTPPSTYTLTYTATNFIKNFSPQDGESATGLFRVPRALLVFKQNHIYRVYNTGSVDPYPAYNVGTYSQESIIQAKDGLYFHHSSGFYKFTYDSQPTEISRRIIDFVKAIPRSSYENIIGVYDGFDAVKWYLGSITVDGVTYTNCCVRYTISTQIWTIYDYAGINITALVRFDNGTTLEQIAGTSTGVVAKIDSGYTDLGSDINYEMIDRWRSYTESYSFAKSISGITVMTQNAGGGMLQYQIEKDGVNEWKEIDTFDENYDSMFPNAQTDDFNMSRFRIVGRTKGTPVIFYGIELLSIQIKGYNEN